MKTGKLYPLVSPVFDTWQKLYETTLVAAATSHTISGLDGDTDETWLLDMRIVQGYNGSTYFGLRPNNDSGANYGYQRLRGGSTTIAAVRGTLSSLLLSSNGGALGAVVHIQCVIHAKSGFVRTAVSIDGGPAVTTTVDYASLIGLSWNNSADNITSLVVLATEAEGLGIGSRISLYKKIRSS